MFENIIKADNPIFIFLILLFIIFVFPPLFLKLKFPSILGLIIAGILIGPDAFGIIKKNIAIELLSKIGLLYIMFLAGLEIDLFKLKNKINNTIVFGLLTFIIPLAMGIIGAYFIFKMNIKSSILLASMFSSHTLLTYSIVSNLGLLKKNSVTATIGGTIITDVLALFILAIIAGSAKNQIGVLYWLKFGIFLVLYILSLTIIIPYIGRLFFKYNKKDDSLEYIFVLFIILLCSYLAYIVGLEPIIGSFMAGLIFNSLIPKKSVLMNRINFIGNTIFIPIFLISIGMHVNLKILFSDIKTWIISIFMITVAIFSKMFASLISQKILKWGKYEGWVSFGMSVNQAAATLAAVLVGYELNFFDDSILTGTIMMIGATCFLGPFITDYFGKKLALSEKEKDYETISEDLRILVPISNKKNIKDLMEISFILYKKYSTKFIYPTNIVIDSFAVKKDILESERVLSIAVAESVAANINVVPITRVDLNISSGILKTARDLRANFIIIGWNGEKSSITKIFSQVIDPIIEDSSQMIIVNKIVHSYRIFKRIVLLIPPLIEKQNGYLEMFDVVKNIAEQLQTSITLIALNDTIINIKKNIQKIKIASLNSFIKLNSWKEVINKLDLEVKEYDIIILLSVRMTSPCWQPLLNKIPGIISEKYSNNNIMIIFPSEEKYESWNLIENKVDYLYQTIKKEDIYLNLNKDKPFDIFKFILSKKFGNKIEILNKLSEELTNIFNHEPIQLLEDVILIHTHISEIDDHIIYIAVNKNGFILPKLEKKAKILIILLNSVQRSPEYHLNLLKEIVKIIKTEGLITALISSNNLKEFENKLRFYSKND